MLQEKGTGNYREIRDNDKRSCKEYKLTSPAFGYLINMVHLESLFIRCDPWMNLEAFSDVQLNP